jgi:hypothetical protein
LGALAWRGSYLADGPADDHGKHQCIRMATYYIRSTGPESVPIPTPDA